MHASRIGASRARSATCSTSSRNFGSAHWRSSITKTTGRSAARCSSSVRTAQSVSSGAVSLPRIPIACPTRSAILAASSPSPARVASLRRAASGVSASLQVRDLDQRLGQRIERDALAVRQAATAQDRRAIADLGDERREQPRLADTRRRRAP